MSRLSQNKIGRNVRRFIREFIRQSVWFLPAPRKSLRRPFAFEKLERRELLTVTVITHGFTLDVTDRPDYPDWPIAMGQAILDRAGNLPTERNVGSMFASSPRTDTNGNSPTWTPINTLRNTNGIWNNSNKASEPIVLLFNWVGESDKIGEDGWLEAAADSLFASLLHQKNDLPGELSGKSFFDIALDNSANLLDFHFIGHSRGTLVNAAVAERFAHYFPTLMIDHVTTLDPHPAIPMNDPWLDRIQPNESLVPTIINVQYADNYYRQDAGTTSDAGYELDLDFNGVRVNGATNLKLKEEILTGSGNESLFV